MSKTIKLLENNRSKINKVKNGENKPNWEIGQERLVHCNIVDNNFQQDSRVLYAFSLNK